MKMTKTVPALPVRNIETAVAFYRDRLGFDIGYHDDGFAIVTRDQAEIHLWAASDTSWEGRGATLAARPVTSGAESFLAGTASCRIEVEDIDPLYAEYRSTGALYDPGTVVEGQPWGTREFPALDLERNLLTFYERT